MYFISNPGSHRSRGGPAALIAVVCCTFAAASLATAQSYPEKAVRLVVGYPPGGSNDIVARIVAPRLGEVLGQPVVVENRAGASGTIGADLVAKSAADGYTLFLSSASPLVISPHALPVHFDTPKDFAAINQIGLTPEAIAVGPALKVGTLRELLERARTRQVNLSSSGTGGLPHLTIELIKAASKGNIVHVPYKGAAPAVADTLGGHVDGIVMDLPPLYSLIKEGKLRALAVTSARRVSFLPDVPTAEEEGLKSFNVVNWVGIFAPAKTPKPVIDHLHRAIAEVVKMPEVVEQLEAAAVVPESVASPAEFQKFLAGEFERWGRVLEESGAVVAK